MTLTDIIEALRTDPGLARELQDALHAQGDGKPSVNVAIWRRERDGWRCQSVGGYHLATIDGDYVYCAIGGPLTNRAAITETLRRAGWVVHP